MKKYILGIISILLLIICDSCSNNSVVGIYVADLTHMQSGSMSTFGIRGDGTATYQQDGYGLKYGYWEQTVPDCIRVQIQGNTLGFYLDFSTHKVYYGAGDWRSKTSGYSFRKK